MKTFLTFLLAVFLLALPLHAQSTKKIHVDELVADHPGDQGVTDLVTAKLISYLTKDGVSVVESADDADAVLTGRFMVTAKTMPNGETGYSVQGAMRLTDRDGKVLWGDVVYSDKLFAKSATSSFAENVAKKVAAFLKPSQKNEK